jgi:FAD/FMN-containing dehydrogenase
MAVNIDGPRGVSDAIARIKDVLGEKGWLETASDTAKYRTDWRGHRTGEALLVARPTTTEETASVVKLAAQAGLAIVPQGGNTGLVQGSIPTEARPTIMISTDRMTQVRSLDADNFALVAEAGCIIQNLQETAGEAGRLFPLSLSSEGSCTVGGTLSTNAGGNQTIKYGNAREQVLGLEVVLPDGTIYDGLNTLRKNNTGYDLKHLFIGAEGTLGIITAAAFRLMPRPRVVETALLCLPSVEAAQTLLSMARELSGDAVRAYEIMPRETLQLAIDHIEGIVDPIGTPSPWYVLMELATSSPIDDLRGKLEVIFEQATEAGLVTDGVIAETEEQRRQIWRPREEQAEAGKRAGWGLTCDVSVPVSKVAEFLTRSRAELAEMMPGVTFNTMGHMGDGNIHYTVRKPVAMDEAVWNQGKGRMADHLNDIVDGYGGSFSAEHGIGAEKRETLEHYAPASKLSLMRTLKGVMDPNGVMNPGKILR